MVPWYGTLVPDPYGDSVTPDRVPSCTEYVVVERVWSRSPDVLLYKRHIRIILSDIYYLHLNIVPDQYCNRY